MDINKIADRIMIVAEDKTWLENRIRFIEKEIKLSPYVKIAGVNDYKKVSNGVYSVDFFIYVAPEVGGSRTQTLKKTINEVAKKYKSEVVSFTPPRSDKTVENIGVSYLIDFYKNNPYKVELIVNME